MASKEVRPSFPRDSQDTRHFTTRLLVLAALWAVVVPHAIPSSVVGQTRRADRSKPTASSKAGAPRGSAKPSTTNAGSTAASQTTGDIVAVVNREKITRAELARESIRRFGKEVLESEVNKHLILAECHQKGIGITKDDVEKEVARIASQFGLPLDRWYAMLQDERGISPGQYKRDIVWPTLALRALAADQLKITPEELERAFQSEYGPKVQVRMIMTESQANAKKLHAQAAAAPQRFDRLAKDNSEDKNSAATRGLIPPIRRHVGDPTIERAAFDLKEGQVSPILSVNNQYFILRCESHMPAVPLTEAQRAAATEQLKQQISDDKLRVAASKKFKSLQQNAKVANVYNNRELRKQMPGVAATVNGGKVTLNELGEQCILRHGKDVLHGEINRRILSQALKRRSIQVTKADIDAEILRAAEAFGFIDQSGKPDVDKWLAEVTKDGEVTVDLYVRDAVWPSVALKKLVNAKVQVTEEDLQKGFVANYGERVEVQAIVLSDHRTANQVFGLARNDPSEKFFGELANQYSVEPVSRANLGQVPPIRRFGGQTLLEDEAFKLAPGEISGVLAIGDKYVILRCLGRTRPLVKELAAVRDELEKDIREKKIRLAMNQEFDRLKESAQIDNFLEKSSQSPRSARVRRASHTDAGASGPTPVPAAMPPLRARSARPANVRSRAR